MPGNEYIRRNRAVNAFAGNPVLVTKLRTLLPNEVNVNIIMLRELGNALTASIIKRIGRNASRLQETTPLPTDLLESDDEYMIVLDAPDVKAEDIQVSYKGRTIYIRIDRFRGVHKGFEMRYPGRGLSLEGRVPLPRDAAITPDKATATLTTTGTLHIRLPKQTVSPD